MTSTKGLSWAWSRGTAILLMLSLSSIVSCHAVQAPKSVEVSASSKGCTTAFVKEHDDLFRENIQLKHALNVCRTGKCL